MVAIVKCPTCRREVEWSDASQFRPFCSDRCRLIDLGAWFAEQHKIPDEAGTAQDQLQADQLHPGSTEDS
jgi:endogenous inhibitor of DNA gyrase (YacG/DUF329 family)